MNPPVTDWRNLYGDSWQGEIDPAAFAHPAKFAHGLIRRIYQHALGNGYIRPGDSVIDPFGGVALGARYALQYGLDWTGVELESKFVDLGQKNIDLWNGRYAAHFPQWGTARLLQGDSRQLAEIVGAKAAVCVSSPPYSESHITGYTTKRIGDNNDSPWKQTGGDQYGATLGQLATLRDAGYTAAISSPPYADAVAGKGEGPGARFDFTYHNGANGHKMSSAAEYGRTAGNLGNLNGNGGYHAAVSSPPFEASLNSTDKDFIENRMLSKKPNGEYVKRGKAQSDFQTYGETAGQLGQDQGETFWTAARLIIEQVYTVLRPGGYAIWVTKNFVRNKARVPFSDQWEQLCAAVGFVPVERVRAWVVEEGHTQMDIFGNSHSKAIERKSFFRRLAEKKGSPRIDWEDVIIMTKAVTP